MNFIYNPVILNEPNSLEFPFSWVGHIPFVFWLIDECKPGSIVELGTHSGNSYFAFCQAVKLSGIDAKCFAIDTWEGDEHAGSYGEEIFNNVKIYNDDNYATFSTLLRCYFDEALNEFQKGSIDILHIDGLHDYASVKHDFESWLPKMSDKGIVLFHDVCVHERDFGVWKLWDEIKDKYPSILFEQSYGLGVIATGTNPPRPIIDLINQSSNADEAVKTLIERLGNEIFERMELERQQKEAGATQKALRNEIELISNQRDEALKSRDENRKELESILASKSWRITSPLRFSANLFKNTKKYFMSILWIIRANGGVLGVFNRLLSISRKDGLAFLFERTIEAIKSPHQNELYLQWIEEYDTVDTECRNAFNKRLEEMDYKPLISVVMPTYKPNIKWLTQAIESVINQIYPNWELCIADDCSATAKVRNLLDEYRAKEPRIKVVFREENGHISAASNSALEMASGEWVALLDHDDILSEHALFWAADAINNNPDIQMIYSDEDKIDSSGRRHGPYFKTDWNIDLFYSHNMFSHLGVYKKKLIDDIQGFRIGLEGAQDYDLALRCIEKVDRNQIAHIPRVLYHWRVHKQSTASANDAKPYAMLAGEKALNEHFQRTGVNASAELIGHGYRIRYGLPEKLPLVSIIIPAKNGADITRQCINSILDKTNYSEYEILLIDNGSDDPEANKYFNSLSSNSKIRVIRDDRPFNYSALNNMAVKLCNGEIVALLNNDVEIITPDWLSEMVSRAIQPKVGAVGAKLWYPDDTLQHGGVIVGINGWAGHSHKGSFKGTFGYCGRTSLASEFSAVTGACLVVEKSKYLQIGGLNEEELKVACSDIDLCLRLKEQGYRNVWTPFAELYHHESITRGYEDTPDKMERFAAEVNYMKNKWGVYFISDPAYSLNLTLEDEDFSLAWPPRVNKIIGS